MKEVIDIGLPPLKQPFSWAVKSAGMLFTAHGPVRKDGTINTGTIEEQTRLTLNNLKMDLDETEFVDWCRKVAAHRA